MTIENKQILIKKIIKNLENELEKMKLSHKSALDGATHTEAKQEGSKDMRSTEASYVARGFAKRVEEINNDINAMKTTVVKKSNRCELGALVSAEDGDGQLTNYFFSPAGAGARIEIDATIVYVLTIKSPLGQAMRGKVQGDEGTLNRAGKSKTFEILTVY